MPFSSPLASRPPRRVHVLVALLGLASVSTVAAQPRVTVSGSVRDAQSGESLPYAHVRLEGTDLATAANVDGHFALVGVPAGPLALLVSYLGYAPARVEVDTDTLAGRPLRIGLRPTAEALDGVVVTAEEGGMMRAGADAGQVRISPRDLAVLPSVGEADVFRSLQRSPASAGPTRGRPGSTSAAGRRTRTSSSSTG